MKRPTTLFHASSPNNIPGIMEKGLLPSTFGGVYLCESMDDCIRIIGSRITHRIIGMEWVHIDDPEQAAGLKEVAASNKAFASLDIREDGSVWMEKPVMETNDHAAVFEIDTGKLNMGRLAYSEDHNPLLFPDLTSWVYWRAIPAHAIKHVTVVPLGDE